MVEAFEGEALSTQIQTLEALFADVKAIWGKRAELREPVTARAAVSGLRARINSLIRLNGVSDAAEVGVKPSPGGIFIDGALVQYYREALPAETTVSPILLKLCNVAREFGGADAVTKIENSSEGLIITVQQPGDEGEMCLLPEENGEVDLIKGKARAVYNS